MAKSPFSRLSKNSLHINIISLLSVDGHEWFYIFPIMNNDVWASECRHLRKVQHSFPLSINQKRDSAWCGGFIFRHLRNLLSVAPAIACCLLSSFWMAPIPMWADTSSSHRGLDSHLLTGNLRIHLGWGKRGSKHVYVGTCAPVWRPSPLFPLMSLKDTGFLIEPGAHWGIFVDWPTSSKDPLLSASPRLTLQVHTPGPVLLVVVVWFDCFGFCLLLSLFNVGSVDQTQHAFITSISPVEPSAWSSLAILMSSLKKMITQSMSPCLLVSFCPVCLPLSWGSPLHSMNSNHFINTRFVNLFF